MKKIAIINCAKMAEKCAGVYCFQSLNQQIDSFAGYAADGCELVGFAHCNKCCDSSAERIVERARAMKKAGADTIHISSCIKVTCPNYQEFLRILAPEFDIMEYTHAVK